MDQDFLKFALTAFTTLLLVIDPFGILPIFVTMTKQHTRAERNGIVNRAVLLGFAICIFFLFAGHDALAYLGVTVHAFSISGGILLFATAMPMLFGHRPALQSAEEIEGEREDIAVFPLAIPLLAGPGTITSILLLTSQARGEVLRITTLAISLALVFLITKIVLSLGNSRSTIARIGPGAWAVATRVLGILLAALAVQFVLNGVTEYVRQLQSGPL